jgi:hypothetical protein
MFGGTVMFALCNGYQMQRVSDAAGVRCSGCQMQQTKEMTGTTSIERNGGV